MSSGSGVELDIALVQESTSLANPITFYFADAEKYPSNSEVWWAMKRPPELGTNAPPKLYLEVFDPGLRYQIFTGGTPAPQGHYILEAFYQDRSAASGIVGLPVVSAASARPRSVAFFAGRVWYAGVQATKYSSTIYFSQILEQANQVGNCFQQYDPTGEDLRDLLPSDGGTIPIPEISVVHHMAPYGQSLLIFAENGLWRISGSDGVGFRANDYSVTKVSGVPTISNLSFVDVEGTPMWWNRSSINTVSVNQNGGIEVISLTDNTIKEFYDGILEESKFNAKGTYDPLTKMVYYLYRSGTAAVVPDPIDPSYLLLESGDKIELEDETGSILLDVPVFNPVEKFEFDRFLCLDTRTGAWMPWSIADNFNVRLLGVYAIATEDSESRVKYTVSVTYDGITFAEETDETYTDFVAVDGIGRDYTSYAVTGYGVFGEGNRQFQGNYLTINYQPVTDGAAYVQGVWKWSISEDTGRWSQKQLVYGRADTGYKHFTRRVIIRGNGEAIQLRFESQPGKPFILNGWSLVVSANSGV